MEHDWFVREGEGAQLSVARGVCGCYSCVFRAGLLSGFEYSRRAKNDAC